MFSTQNELIGAAYQPDVGLSISILSTVGASYLLWCSIAWGEANKTLVAIFAGFLMSLVCVTVLLPASFLCFGAVTAITLRYFAVRSSYLVTASFIVSLAETMCSSLLQSRVYTLSQLESVAWIQATRFSTFFVSISAVAYGLRVYKNKMKEHRRLSLSKGVLVCIICVGVVGFTNYFQDQTALPLLIYCGVGLPELDAYIAMLASVAVLALLLWLYAVKRAASQQTDMELGDDLLTGAEIWQHDLEVSGLEDSSESHSSGNLV